MERRTFLSAGAAAWAASLSAAATPAKGSGDPIEDLPNLTEHVPPVPAGELESRMEKARRLLADSDAQALFIEPGSSLFYFSGVRWGRSERMFALLIPRKGAPAFVSPAFEKGRALEQVPFKDPDVRIWQEHESPFVRVRQILSDRGIRTGRVAVEPTVRFFLVSGMRRSCPGLDFVDGSTVSEGCRRVKSHREIEYMRLANIITKKAYHAALWGLKEGMSARRLAARISRAHARMGAPGGAMVLFGPHSALPHGSRKRRPLREGDVVLMDGGCSVQGYRSDVTRTGVWGRPSEKQRRVWGIVRRAQEKALAAARPGVPCQEVDRVARRVIAEAGFGPGYRYFTHRLGHGIGLDGHEAPYLVEGNTLELEVGMTFSDEPGIYIPGEWGVRHEDIMVITPRGAEFLGEATHDILHPV